MNQDITLEKYELSPHNNYPITNMLLIDVTPSITPNIIPNVAVNFNKIHNNLKQKNIPLIKELQNLHNQYGLSKDIPNNTNSPNFVFTEGNSPCEIETIPDEFIMKYSKLLEEYKHKYCFVI